MIESEMGVQMMMVLAHRRRERKRDASTVLLHNQGRWGNALDGFFFFLFIDNVNR